MPLSDQDADDWLTGDMADEPEEDTPEQGPDEENGDDATDVEEDISAAEEAVDLPADADISAEDTVTEAPDAGTPAAQPAEGAHANRRRRSSRHYEE